jgi:hypothetical protein
MRCISIVSLFLAILDISASSSALPPSDSDLRDEANPVFCATHTNGHYAVDLYVEGVVVNISILDHQKKLFGFSGNDHTVFAISGKTLWYLNGNASSAGGASSRSTYQAVVSFRKLFYAVWVQAFFHGMTLAGL